MWKPNRLKESKRPWDLEPNSQTMYYKCISFGNKKCTHMFIFHLLLLSCVFNTIFEIFSAEIEETNCRSRFIIYKIHISKKLLKLRKWRYCWFKMSDFKVFLLWMWLCFGYSKANNFWQIACIEAKPKLGERALQQLQFDILYDILLSHIEKAMAILNHHLKP